MRPAHPLLFIALLIAGTVSPVIAQGPWSVFIGGGAAGFGGASTRTSPEVEGEVVQFKPSPTTRLHLGIARALGKASIAIDASYAKSGLGGYSSGGSYSLSPAMTLYDVRLLAGYELLTLGQSTPVRLALGPMLQVWTGDAIIDTQTRLGGAVALDMSVPVSRRVAALISGSLGVAGSPFAEETLDSIGPFEPATTWTRELALGLRFSL